MNELDLSRNVGRCQKYLHNISLALNFYPSLVSKKSNTHLKWQQETIAWLFLPGNSSKIKKKIKTMFTSSRQLKAGVKIACPSQFTIVRNPFKHSFSFHLTAQEHKEKDREKPPKHTLWQVFYIPPNDPRQLRNTLGLYSKNQLADPPCWCLSWKQSIYLIGLFLSPLRQLFADHSYWEMLDTFTLIVKVFPVVGHHLQFSHLTLSEQLGYQNKMVSEFDKTGNEKQRTTKLTNGPYYCCHCTHPI